MQLNRKFSVYISLALTAVMFLAVAALAFYIPTFLERLISIPDRTGAKPVLSPFLHAFVYISFYAELALMLVGLGLLFALLILVQKKRVFSAPAVELIRFISWCLILMGIIMTALTFFRTNALIVGVAFLFVGLTVRVVKNVIEAAVYLKEENDLTV